MTVKKPQAGTEEEQKTALDRVEEALVGTHQDVMRDEVDTDDDKPPLKSP